MASHYRTRLQVEGLDDRITPSGFTGLNIAVEHFIPVDPCMTHSPVLVLNFNPTGGEVLPARNGLDVAVERFGPNPPPISESPVFVGLIGGSVDTLP
jgi:hypothetical protein